jgi:hypothetical protein
LRQQNSNEWGKATPLLIPRSFFPLKRNCIFSASTGSREKNQVNLACPVGPEDRTGVNPVRKYFGFMFK